MQIGCSLFDVIALGDGLDMWVDDEALVAVDLGDRAAVDEALNPVATLIAQHYGQSRPVFGAVVLTARCGENTAPLDESQLARVGSVINVARALFGSEHLAARAARLPVRMQIRVECAYSDGHESTRTEMVEVQPFTDLEDLWDQLWDQTGDGHGIGRDAVCLSTVTVLESPARPALVGLSNEWA